jgi:co-chaperonin GroES (HSP10)
MIKPLRSNVLIRPSDVQQESKIGIIIQSSVSNEGVIKAIGMDVKELKVGETVRYDVQAAVRVDGYLMCREADVLCVVE